MANNIKISIPSQTPICNPDTGVVNQEWRIWFNKIYQRMGGAESSSNTDLVDINKQILIDIKNLQDLIIFIDTKYSEYISIINRNKIDIFSNTIAIRDNKEKTLEVSNLADANEYKLNNLQDTIIDLQTNVIDLQTNAIKTISNVGTGATIYKDKSANNANLKTIKAGTNITVDNNTSEIVINSTYSYSYTLPIASTTVLGGFKVGANLTIDPATGVLSASSGTPYTLPIASTTVLGGFKVGANLTIDPATGVLNATGGGSSLIVNNNSALYNSDVKTLDLINFSLLNTTGNTVSIDNFFNADNLKSWWYPSFGTTSPISSSGSYTITGGANLNLTTIKSATHQSWWAHTAKVILEVQTDVTKQSSVKCSSTAMFMRNIYKRCNLKMLFGYEIPLSGSGTTLADCSFFCGLSGGPNTIPYTLNYSSTNLNGLCGIGFRPTDSNLMIVYKNHINVLTWIDLTSDFPIPDCLLDNRNYYELEIESMYSSEELKLTLRRLDDSTEISYILDVYDDSSSYMNPNVTLQSTSIDGNRSLCIGAIKIYYN